jgi:hypothetical protein
VISYVCKLKNRATGDIRDIVVVLTDAEVEDVEHECSRRNLAIEIGFAPLEATYALRRAAVLLGGHWHPVYGWEIAGHDLAEDGLIRLPVGRQRWH